jgi:hypothetical protein
MQSIDSKALSRIYGRGRGAVFTPNAFLDLGSRNAIDKALSRLAAQGPIRRLARGLYDYPKTHPVLGMLSPTPDAIARALAGKSAIRLQPTGAYAANLLHLSDQVPARIVFLTNGAYKTVQVGSQTIQLKRTTPKNMATAGRMSGLVIQALRHLGRKHVDDTTIDQLRRLINAEDKKQLLKDMHYAPGWVAEHMRAIAEGTVK